MLFVLLMSLIKKLLNEPVKIGLIGPLLFVGIFSLGYLINQINFVRNNYVRIEMVERDKRNIPLGNGRFGMVYTLRGQIVFKNKGIKSYGVNVLSIGNSDMNETTVFSNKFDMVWDTKAMTYTEHIYLSEGEFKVTVYGLNGKGERLEDFVFVKVDN